MIDSAINNRILAALTDLEREEGVRILYAVESGSRAWGFASTDSDYDVRFIYARPSDWYLSVDLESRRDTLQRPITADLDIDGWDLRKALKLVAKSNPPLLEWLDSSIVYLDRFGFAAELRQLRDQVFSPLACAYHYLHMAQSNDRAYLQGERVWLKKYFYVLRPLLAVRWIEQQGGVVPMAFEKLLVTIADQPELLAAIAELLRRKRAVEELDEGPAVPVLQKFIAEDLARLEMMPIQAASQRFDWELLNRCFRMTLARAWNGAA